MKPLLSVKLRNSLKSRDPSLDASSLKNIIVNGQKRGCSGFVTDPSTGKTAYVNTERGFLNKYLYRSAKDCHDYTGGQNLFADNEEELVNGVLSLVH